MAYDHVVSALGRICEFHCDNIDSTQVVPAWLNCLLIKGNLIEAKVVHNQLCSMVESSDRELWGPDNQYLLKIVSVFTECLCSCKYLQWRQMIQQLATCYRHGLGSANVWDKISFLTWSL